MRIAASDFVSYYRPSKCELRLYLRHHGEPEEPPSPYEETLRRLGERHEKAHLATFPVVVDLSLGSLDDRRERTRGEVEKRSPVIYQPILEAMQDFNGTRCQISGEPDFLILTPGGYAIRDCKIARRITEKDHPEILLQIGTYAWLFQQTFGHHPSGLEVYSGSQDVIPMQWDNSVIAGALFSLLSIKQSTSEPRAPVGWTKCDNCAFHSRCWSRAEQSRSVALLIGVDQGLASALHDIGVEKVEDLLCRFNEKTLSDFQRPWGSGVRKVGSSAAKILRMARVLSTGRQVVISAPKIPICDNYVMFDVEGLPPQLDELEKIYLWGLQAFGKQPGEYLGASSGSGVDGDRDAWESFLKNAGSILRVYGDIPFVHWHHYERTHIDMYTTRFGDPHGIAARVRRNLVDLLPIAQESIALPLPSYSLKVVERYIGFERSQEEYGGDWAMAKYVEATETEDEQQRAALIDEIVAYNREDLEATWAVLRWLRGLAGQAIGV